MLYLILLIILTILASRALRRILLGNLSKKENLLKAIGLECAELAKKTTDLETNNLNFGQKVSQTIALYNITKEICKILDEEKIFTIFKEQINSCIKVSDCRFLNKDADLSVYKGYVNLPLVIQDDIIGYLVANVEASDRDKFGILAGQFLVGMKRALLYKQMQELSITDSLTQVFSRRHFLDRFNEEFLRSKKFSHNFSFLMLDLDHFKIFNDKYGHLVGDAILREVSRVAKEVIRQIDFVGRYGGEEFSIVLAETDKEHAHSAAERLRQAIETRVIKAFDEELKVTVSIGISTFPRDGVSIEALIEAADKALYLAKQRGRNQICSFTKYLA